jgi:hypothetical protein
MMIDGGHNKGFVFCSARWVKHVMNLSYNRQPSTTYLLPPTTSHSSLSLYNSRAFAVQKHESTCMRPRATDRRGK